MRSLSFSVVCPFEITHTFQGQFTVAVISHQHLYAISIHIFAAFYIYKYYSSVVNAKFCYSTFVQGKEAGLIFIYCQWVYVMHTFYVSLCILPAVSVVVLNT